MAERCISCMRMIEETNCPHCGYPAVTKNEGHQLQVGTVLRGRYQIGKVLGQGGFGITYLAWDNLMRQSVAVKEFYPGGTVYRKSTVSTRVECVTDGLVPHYDYSKERFLREASALVDFRDIPEVVDILDFIEENNTAYIVMEYVKGVDLARYIQNRGGRLSVQETFRILKPVMEALAKVHKGGIVHRDISPDNIILDPVGGAKLLDFGAVRAVENPDVDEGLNKSTEAILKHGFAPLEQYNSRGSLGPWTDEYAMCATIWYCLTGTIPVEASIRMTEGIDPDWSTIPGLPEHQRRALEKGFSSRARDRFESMDALLDALFPEAEKAAPPAELPKAEVPQKAETPKKAPKQPKEQKPTGTKKPLIFALAAAAVLLVLIAAVVLLPGKQEGDSPAQLQEAPGTLPSEAPGETQPNTPETIPTTEATEPPTEPLSEEERNYLQAEQLLAEGKLGEAAIAFGKLAGYSDARARSFDIWDKIAVRDTITGGFSHSLGLRVDGTVVATGDNRYGQCNVESFSDIVAIAAAGNHTLGLKADGTVVTVGVNGDGQCDVEGWSDIVAIATAGSHTLGLKADGTVIAVGYNGTGQCNVETWSNIVAIAVGQWHTLGLKADGTVVVTGSNSDGQCAVEDWSDIVAIAAAEKHTIGLKSDGTVLVVGPDYTNWLYKCSLLDVESWGNITAVTAGQSHILGLKADGTIMTAGYNGGGQCNAEDWSGIEAIAAGRFHTLGLKTDGTVVAVGDNSKGECNVSDWTNIRILQRVAWYDQEDAPAETTPPEEDSANAEAYANAEKLLSEGKLGEAAIAFGKLAGYSNARELSFEIWDKIAVRDTISAGLSHTVGLRTDGTIVAVGSDLYGQCDVSEWSDIVAVCAGSWNTVGLRIDGTVVAVGDNSDGNVEGWTNIVAISAGSSNTVGLKADGTVVAVGLNDCGQCDVGNWSDIVAISASSSHTVGLRADGTVVAVGQNNCGQCDVGNWSDIVAISASGRHTVGLRADGTVVAVGQNDDGQCDASSWTDIVAVSADGFHTVGLRADGTVVAAGRNDESQCDVNSWTDILAVCAGYWHTVGLRADGTVVAVGSNQHGQIGMVYWTPWTDIRIPNKLVPFR